MILLKIKEPIKINVCKKEVQDFKEIQNSTFIIVIIKQCFDYNKH